MKAPSYKYPLPEGGFKAHRLLPDGTTQMIPFRELKVGEKAMVRTAAGRPMIFNLAKRGMGKGPQKLTAKTPLRKLDIQQRKMPESVAKKLAALGPRPKH